MRKRHNQCENEVQSIEFGYEENSKKRKMRQPNCRVPCYAKVIIVALILGGIITGLVFLFKSRPEKEPEIPKTKMSPLAHQDDNRLIMTKMEFNQNLHQFSSKIFEQVSSLNNGKNIILSSLSIETSLAMVRMGTEGETAQEMDLALNMTGYNAASVAENFLSLLKDLEENKFLHMANKIYVNKNVELHENYESVIKDKFLASTENIDFKQSQEAANSINKWVENKTNNTIQNLIASDMLNSDTMAVLLSAIHFEDEWRTQFPKVGTKESDFYIGENKTIKVQMMHSLSNYIYKPLPEINAQMLQLPYKNSNFSMIIYLPNTRTGLPDVMANLKNNLPNTLKLLKDTNLLKIDLYLPKFKAEFEMELNESLKKLGMRKAFESGDFQNMLKTYTPIAISKVVHKAFIDVDERGTKAAAATGSVAQSRSLVEGIPMICDHPFYYMIVNADCLPIFEGVVMNF